MTAPDLTPLDLAHAAMEARPEDDAARLRFYDCLGSSELFLLLDAEPEGDTIRPRLFELEDGPVAVVFDRELRLAEFAGGIVPYVALSGRVLAEMFAGQGIGLGLNLDVAPSAILLPAPAVDWMQAQFATRPVEAEAIPREIRAPAGLPEALLTALDGKLALAAGLAGAAHLVAVTYGDGRHGHLLGFTGALPGAEPALARVVHEALVFSGLAAGELDVAFLAEDDETAARLARVGLRFDLPAPPRPEGPAAPGMDPDAPPILR